MLIGKLGLGQFAWVRSDFLYVDIMVGYGFGHPITDALFLRTSAGMV